MAWFCLIINHPPQMNEIKAAERDNPSPLPRLASWQHLPCFALLSPFDSPGCILLLNYHLLTPALEHLIWPVLCLALL